jgi:hypothetical protein
MKRDKDPSTKSKPVRTMVFTEKASTVPWHIDTVDYFLATIAKLKLISEKTNDHSWHIAYSRFIASR